MGGKEVVSKVKEVNKKIKAEHSDQEHKEIHNVSENGVHIHHIYSTRKVCAQKQVNSPLDCHM